MRYLQGRKLFDMRILSKELPEPAGNDVLVRVLACGVCGTDVHLLSKADEYAPLGHEISAEVVRVGGNVRTVAAGDRVVVEDCTLCGVCERCKSGQTHLCRSMYTLDGQSGMGEYLLVRENSLHKHKLSDPVHAALVEPLAVSLATCSAANVPALGNVVIFGLGVLGLMCAAITRRNGAGKIVCVGGNGATARNKARGRAALELGADAVLFTSDEAYQGDLERLTGGRVDAVIVTSPPKTLPLAINAASYGAPVVTIGLDLGEEASVPVNIDRLIMNKNPIIPVFAEPANMFPLSIRMLEDCVIDPAKLITHTFSIDEADTLRDIYLSDSPVIKAVLVNRE